MANPTNLAAREAITSDLGVEPCIVQGDRLSIDRLVAELWCEEERKPSHLLAHAPAGSCVGELRAYAEYLRTLLGASLDYAPGEVTVDTLMEKTRHDYELVIVGKPGGSARKSLFAGSFALAALNRLSVSTLIAEQPCWPLRRLLIVIQGETSDEGAMHWLLRLAEPSEASVTALAVVPPVPAMYHGLERMEGGLAELLATDDNVS